MKRYRVALILSLAIAPTNGWGEATPCIATENAGIASVRCFRPLPPAAQEAFDQGIIATRVPDYPLAIRRFEEARKLTSLVHDVNRFLPTPMIYLNLGMAESRIPGRELRAIAWFGAYLAAYPTAPNGVAVKKQIAMLEARNHSNVARMIEMVQAAADKLAGDKIVNLNHVAVMWARTGDTARALSCADLIFRVRSTERDRALAQSDIAQARAQSGDIAGARKIAELIHEEALRSETQSEIALADQGRAQGAIAQTQARSGDIAGARKTADLIYREFWKEEAHRMISIIDRTHEPVIVDDWLEKLDYSGGAVGTLIPLNSEPFLDPAGHLKALPFDNPQKAFDELETTAWRMIGAQDVVSGMLKLQKLDR